MSGVEKGGTRRGEGMVRKGRVRWDKGMRREGVEK